MQAPAAALFAQDARREGILFGPAGGVGGEGGIRAWTCFFVIFFSVLCFVFLGRCSALPQSFAKAQVRLDSGAGPVGSP